jgi:hypothetical protein
MVTNWVVEDEQKLKIKENCKTALIDFFKLVRSLDNSSAEVDIAVLMEDSD